MPEVLKNFPITIDIKKSLTNDPFQVVEGDNGNTFTISVVNSGAPVDLSACRVIAVFSHANGTAMQDSQTVNGGVTIGGTDHNEITLRLFSGSFNNDGVTECEIQIYSGTDLSTLITSSRFNFEARRSLVNNDTIQAQDKYPVLTGLIQQVTQLVTGMQPNWIETDPMSAGFIKNKPNAFNPSLHASSHSSSGADAITPASIGAMPSTTKPVPASHASAHAAGGEDPVTPEDIGAAASAHTHTPDSIGAASLADGKVEPSQASAAISTQTAAYTLALGDAGTMILMDSAEAVALTVPPSASVAFPLGTEIEICQRGVGVVTIAAGTGVTILSADSGATTVGQYACAALKLIGADTWLLAGGIG